MHVIGVGLVVGASVGDSDGTSVGARDGLALGATVGDVVGLSLGAAVVGERVGASVLSQQERKFPVYAFGQQVADVNPCSTHRACAPQDSSTVGLRDGAPLGLALGDADGLTLSGAVDPAAQTHPSGHATFLVVVGQ